MGESTESINELTTSELLLVSSDVSNYKKSATAAWIIWLVLGLLGGHRYYFNQKKSATVMALITILSAGMGVIITLPWMLYDASQINKWLRLDIKEIENKSIDKILRNRKKIVKKALLDNSNKETINDTNEKPAPVSKKLSDSIVSLDNNEDCSYVNKWHIFF
ncbi:TM2 domain-containing protein [Latilactobacillus curvatus]|uniref:TM2 domain-containing protein n=1 Tax=Latilactobacillus curvatus TaxID=28038 RepID=UPI0020C7B235|nr:TM2 domain-containing protein [Latilactobacillus curvatus]MCP8858897.1 TM2 domain-containing protein [Latilactobacillus curvatus]